MKMRTIFVSVGIMLLCAAASFAQQVKTDYDRGADFSQYKTYSWEKVQTQDPLWVSRIKQAVNADLAAKGWTPVSFGRRCRNRGDGHESKAIRRSTPITTASEEAGAGAVDSGTQPHPLIPTK